MLKRIFWILFVACFFVFVQKASAYSISPTKYLITIDPGKTQIATIVVKNEESMPLTFNIKVFGLKQSSEGRPVVAKDVDVAEKWVTPEASSLTVEPGATQTIKFDITAPEGAKSGSHYLALGIEPVISENMQVSVSSRLVSLLTLQVAGLVNESLTVNNWQAENQIINNKNNWKFNLQLANKGNIEVATKGTLTIKSWRGQDLYSDDVKIGNVLSGAERSLVVSADPGKASIYMPGLYQAQIKILYGRTGQQVISMTNFWYLPTWIWWLGIGVLVGIVLIVIILVRIPRKK